MRLGVTNWCPSCDSEIDAATSIDGAAAVPAEGDYTLCAYCGVWLVFRADLSLRYPTSREAVDLSLGFMRRIE